VWAPWLADLAGYRALLVELPGQGLSGPVAYRRGAVRDHTLRLMDDLFDALGLATAPVVGHSLGALRSPAPRRVYRRLLGQGLSPAAAAAAPDDLLDVLRLAARRPGNARTVASLMHAGAASAAPARTTSCPAASSARSPPLSCSAGGPGTRSSHPHRPVPPSPRSQQQCFMRYLAGTAPGWKTPLAAPGSPPATSPRRDSRPPPSARDPAGQIKAVLRAREPAPLHRDGLEDLDGPAAG